MKTNKSPRYLYNLHLYKPTRASQGFPTICPVFTSNNRPCFHFKHNFFFKSLSTFKKSILQIIRPSPSSTYNCGIITRELNTLPDYVLDYVLIQCAFAEWILTQLVIVYSIASIFQMKDLLT